MLAALQLGLLLSLVVTVIAIKVAIFLFFFASFDSMLDLFALFLLLLGQLQVETLLLLLLFDLRREGSPGEFDRDGAFVHDLVVLVAEEGDGGGLSVDVALGEVDVVVVGLAD